MRYFDEANEPVACWRALQIWQILVSVAHNNSIITYGQLAKIVGYRGSRGLAHPLGRIMAYCWHENLPALTTLVVNKNTGLPGRGLKTVDGGVSVDAERMLVYKKKWYDMVPPTVDEFEDAYNAYIESI